MCRDSQPAAGDRTAPGILGIGFLTAVTSWPGLAICVASAVHLNSWPTPVSCRASTRPAAVIVAARSPRPATARFGTPLGQAARCARHVLRVQGKLATRRRSAQDVPDGAASTPRRLGTGTIEAKMISNGHASARRHIRRRRNGSAESQRGAASSWQGGWARSAARLPRSPPRSRIEVQSGGTSCLTTVGRRR
jgi:hypothetical protein